MDEERKDDPLGDNRGVEDLDEVGDVGSSGKVDETGAGLGEGICLSDSRDDRCIAEGNGGRRAKGLSFRLYKSQHDKMRSKVKLTKCQRLH